MSDSKQDLTLLVLSGETSPVRRLRLRRAWFKRGAIAAGAISLGLSVAAIDYVRLRSNAVDVERMRAETARQREELAALSGRLGGLAQEFETLRELERKVRVIANLPERVQEARVPSNAGQGGAEEADGPSSDALVSPPPNASDAGIPEREEPAAALSDEDLNAAISRIELRASRLASLMPERRESFAALAAGLADRRDQLAATPSIWPTSGWVTSGYGIRISPFTGRRQFHSGIDIAADFGTAIIAPASGRVVFAGRKGAYGRIVEIDHGYGIHTLYGHTDEVFVRTGQRVERGVRIAAVGSSGRSTGPHVHYQVKVGGRTVNPSDYIFE